MEEIWKDVKGYEGLYQVSDLGRVKSLNFNKTKVEKILTQGKNTFGYKHVTLSKNGQSKTSYVHSLVAANFLNHKPDGRKIVIDHINFIRHDNRLCNLRLVTNRENTNKKHLKSTSKYTGVSWYKITNKWVSQITMNGTTKNLGYFKNEHDAHLAYEKALKDLMKLQ